MTNSTISLLQNNIKKYRKAKGFTQLQLAVRAGISKDYIVAIELGKRVPSVKTLILIAKALNIDIRELFTK